MEAERAAFWPHWTAVSLQVTRAQQGGGSGGDMCLECMLGHTKHCVTLEAGRTQLGHLLTLPHSRSGLPSLTLKGRAQSAALPA